IAGDSIGYGERGVVVGLIELQMGNVASSITHFELADRDAHTEGERAFARSALALALVAAGEPERAIETAASLSDLTAGTYLDRMTAALARGFAHVRLGDADRAIAALDEANVIVDG